MSLKHIVHALVEYEKSIEDQLDLLTSIGITARNEDIFKACERVREEIVPDSEEVSQGREDLLRGSEILGFTDNDTGTEESTQLDEEE